MDHAYRQHAHREIENVIALAWQNLKSNVAIAVPLKPKSMFSSTAYKA